MSKGIVDEIRASTIDCNLDMIGIGGLTESEVLARRQRGEGNDVEFETSRSYSDIIRHNVFNFINIVIFTLGAVLILLGRPRDAILSAGLIVLNVIIGIIQEVRAKNKLDEIALLTRPKARVIRQGQEKTVDPTELVKGDILVVRPGDQMVVDGQIIGDGRMEVDESLLTGESDLVTKQEGDAIYSGSFCVTGTALYEAQKVGAESYANQLTAKARQFQVTLTPLQKEIQLVVRILMVVAGFYGFLLFVEGFIYDTPLVVSAQVAAVIGGMIPNGLFFMIIVAYSLGAVRIAGQGALVQQSNAIEALSHVNVLCTDKTGTLTANRINYHDILPVNIKEERVRAILADFASSASVTNTTSEAIREALGGKQRPVVDEVTFSSARKWSALAFDDAELQGVYVLGALEMLQPFLSSEDAASPNSLDGLFQQVKTWSDEGLRVLLFAHNQTIITLHDARGEPSLPELFPLGLMSFSDELRPQVRETISGFTEAGIRLKIISGDSPDTVAALAKQAGLPSDLTAVAGPDLAQMDEAQFAQTADEATVFGRITPEQKERLVDALRQRKQYVAMIGDGVNDVLSLKKANVSIAMQSGSGATRGVADLILLDDSFAALLPAFTEGQRIVNGMGDILRLFLSRSFSLALLIAALAMIVVGFPTTPPNEALVSLFGVGIPTFFLALWAHPGQPGKSLLSRVQPFIAPAVFSIMAFGLILYSLYFVGVFKEIFTVPVTQEDFTSFETYAGHPVTTGDALKEATAGVVGRTVLTLFRSLAGIFLVWFVAPPINIFVANRELSLDKRPAILAVGLLLLLVFIVAVEPLRKFFQLVLLRPVDYLVIGAAVVLWALVVRAAWRAHTFERFLALEDDEA